MTSSPQKSGEEAGMALLELALFVALLRAQKLSATCTERELQRHLTSSEPPYDNYYNISKAVYPSIDLPSLLIKITVRFHQSINQRLHLTSNLLIAKWLISPKKIISPRRMHPMTLCQTRSGKILVKLLTTRPRLTSFIRGVHLVCMSVAVT